MGEEHRTKIRNSKILNRLIAHVEGEIEMTSTQVSAGLGLLAKVMPNLSESDVKHTVTRAGELADDELANIAVGGGEGAADEAEVTPVSH